MICKNKNLIFAAFEVVASSLQDLNNGQELLIVSFIMSLSKNHLLREKCHRMPLGQIMQSQLTKNLTNSIAKCIRFNLDITL